MVLRTSFLANWRTEQVYSPYVADQIRAHGGYDRQNPGSEAARLYAEQIAALWKNEGAKTQPFNTRPPRRDGNAPVA